MDSNTFINLIFGTTTLFTVWFFYRASSRSLLPVLILFGWIILQSVLAAKGFYLVTETLPPRMALVLVPAMIMILLLLITAKGKKFTAGLDIKWLTLLHVVRLPVEIGLYLLFLQKQVPELMTFEGRNFDILAGISAPFIWFFMFVKKVISKKVLLTWNIICLALLMNILINAALSIPGPLQQFGLDQPNFGILYFPVILLPALIVPLVLFSHLVCIAQLSRKDGSTAR